MIIYTLIEKQYFYRKKNSTIIYETYKQSLKNYFYFYCSQFQYKLGLIFSRFHIKLNNFTPWIPGKTLNFYKCFG